VVKNDCARSKESSTGIRARHVAAEGLRGVGPEVRRGVPRDAGGLAGHRPIRQPERPLERLLLGGKRHFDLVHETAVSRLRGHPVSEQEVATDLHLRRERASGGG